MNPTEKESIKDKSERYNQTYQAVQRAKFRQASRPPSSLAEERGGTLRIEDSDPDRVAIEQNNIAVIRSRIRTLNEIAPNGYFEELLKKTYISWEEYKTALNRFLLNSELEVRLLDEKNNLNLQKEREAELASQQPEDEDEEEDLGDEASGGVHDQEEDQAHERQSEEEGSSAQNTGTRPPPRRILVKAAQPNLEERLNKANQSMQDTQKKLGQPDAPKLTESMEENLNKANTSLNRTRTLAEPRQTPAESAPAQTAPASSPQEKLDQRIKNANQAMRRVRPTPGNIINSRNRRRAATALLRGGGSGFGIPWPLLQNAARALIRSAVNLGSNLVRGAFNLGGRALGQLFGRQGALAAGRFGVSLAGPAIAAVALNPFTWIVVITTTLFGLTMWWAGEMDKASNDGCSKPGTVEVDKSNKAGEDATVQVGQNIEYEIFVVYNIRCTRATATMEIKDTLPPNTTFVSASATVGRLPTDPTPSDEILALEQGVYQNNTVTWKINGVLPERPVALSLVITPRAETNNTWVMNQATVSYTESRPLVTAGEGNIPPTQENCNGKYPLNNPIGNFGDPTCKYTPDDLYSLLQQIDPINAKYWFDVVVKCESSYSPNAHADHAIVGTPDAGGAWGLFQMGRGKNGQYDHGDVVWNLQTTNAVNYNNNLATKWRYWACARSRW
jgi:uncharacterized repeat protein (TIGR01451 family)